MVPRLTWKPGRLIFPRLGTASVDSLTKSGYGLRVE